MIAILLSRKEDDSSQTWVFNKTGDIHYTKGDEIYYKTIKTKKVFHPEDNFLYLDPTNLTEEERGLILFGKRNWYFDHVVFKDN